MKLKDILTSRENKNNKQINLSLKKKKMKALGLSTSDLLNINVDRYLKK